MTSSKIFEKRDFLWDKATVEWRIRIRDLDWHVTWILLKGENLKQKLKRFQKLSKLEEVVSKLVQTKRITTEGLGASRWASFCVFFLKKNSYFNAVWITFRTCLEPFERTKV